MSIYTKHVLVALTVSISFILLNIIAVTNGSADAYYANIDKLVESINLVPMR